MQNTQFRTFHYCYLSHHVDITNFARSFISVLFDSRYTVDSSKEIWSKIDKICNFIFRFIFQEKFQVCKCV